MLTITRLLEVGRVLSKANEAKLRAAVDALSAVLSALGPAKEAVDRSFENRRVLLAGALEDEAEAANPGAEYYPTPWVVDVFDTHFVYCAQGDYYDRTYAIDDSGVVTMGAPMEVTPRMVYDPAPADAGAEDGMAESAIVGDIQPLVESGTLRESSTANLKLIAPGWGSSGYYPADVLRRDGPAVFTAGTQMFWDHPTNAEEAARPEGSLSRLAAQLETDARWEDNGPAGPGLYARAKVYERYAGDLADIAEDIGVSIRASGAMKSGEADGRKGPIVERIVSARSVDFVTRPGAGGRVLELFEAAGRRAPAAPRPAADGRDSNQEQSSMTEAEAQALRETVAAQTAELARLREGQLLRDAREFAARRLAGIDLPQITRDRLSENLARNPVTRDGALDTAAFGTRIDEAAAAEARYIEQLTGTGRVRELGATNAGGGEPQPVTEAQLAQQFVALGMSEAAAQVAAKGGV